MRWSKCGECGHVFTEGYFDADGLGILFSTSLGHQNIATLPQELLEQQRLVCARIVVLIASLRGVAGGRWLDVGCGSG